MEPRIVDVTPSESVPGPSKTPPSKDVTLYVGTPAFGCMVSTAYVLSLMQLQAECNRRGIKMVVDFIGNESLVQRARNLITARFLKSGASHLLFIDADIGFGPDTVFRLIDANKDIATAVYPKKAFNWAVIDEKLRDKCTEPVHMAGLDYNINITGTATVVNGFVHVLDSATGFMLISRAVIEHMAKAYAGTLTCANDLPGAEDPGYIKEYVALFDCMIDPSNRRYLSEDYAFSRRAQEQGFEVWADVASPLCHVGNYSFEGDLRQRFTMVYAG